MYCPRCDSPVPPGSNFCMKCGNSLTVRSDKSTPRGMPAAQAPAPAPVPIRNTQVMPYVIMACAVLIVFLLGWGISNALQQRAQVDNTLKAPHKTEPVMIAMAAPDTPMPPSVRDWLEHLRRIEEQKNKLSAQQVAELKTFSAKFEALGPAAGLLSQSGDDEDNTDPTVPVKETISDMSAPWDKLVKDYQSVPPPPECQKLADEYFAGLNEIPAEMTDIQKLVDSITQGQTSSPNSGENDANKDALKQATEMQGTSKADIDTHFANSDDMLADVCEKYKTRKWFTIQQDLGGGLMGSPF